jgi:hypothetical protein
MGTAETLDPPWEAPEASEEITIAIPAFAHDAVMAAVSTARANREFLERVRGMAGVVGVEPIDTRPVFAAPIRVLVTDEAAAEAVYTLEAETRRRHRGSRLDVRVSEPSSLTEAVR